MDYKRRNLSHNKTKLKNSFSIKKKNSRDKVVFSVIIKNKNLSPLVSHLSPFITVKKKLEPLRDSSYLLVSKSNQACSRFTEKLTSLSEFKFYGLKTQISVSNILFIDFKCSYF